MDMRLLCVVCGADMSPCRSDKMYCTKKCANTVYTELNRKAREEEKAGRTCDVCGGPIAITKNRDARHCSTKCLDRKRAPRERRAKK